MEDLLGLVVELLGVGGDHLGLFVDNVGLLVDDLERVVVLLLQVVEVNPEAVKLLQPRVELSVQVLKRLNLDAEVVLELVVGRLDLSLHVDDDAFFLLRELGGVSLHPLPQPVELRLQGLYLLLPQIPCLSKLLRELIKPAVGLGQLGLQFAVLLFKHPNALVLIGNDPPQVSVSVFTFLLDLL